jgi:hypothetical protein
MSTKPSTGRVRSTYAFIKTHRDQYSVQIARLGRYELARAYA